MNNWTDTHAHIYLDDFKEDREEMISRAADAGVANILMPNIDHTSIDQMLETEMRFRNCVSMMGLHPCSVKKDFQRELYLVEEWLSKRDFVAIGEIGTDLYWDKSFWEEQQEAMNIQISWAKKYKKPIVIHCRESLDQTIEIIKTQKDENLRGVFHCFTGTVDQAREICDLGFHVGLGGVATFKNGGMDQVIPHIDLSMIVLETDSPYLTPAPHRGKRNEPSYIPLIATKVSDFKGITLEELARITTSNAKKLFNY